MINNTILFTPSHEQLVAIAKDHPELNQEIKEAVLKDLKQNAYKFVQSRLQTRTNTMFEALYNEVEKKYFNKGDSWKGTPSSFGEEIKNKFIKEIDEHLNSELEKEISQYIESTQFQTTLKNKTQERILNLALKNIDAQIAEEAKKLVA